MPVAKKTTKAKTAKPKPAAVKPKATKPTVARKAKTNPKPKNPIVASIPEVKVPKLKVVKARKPRGPNKPKLPTSGNLSSSFAQLLAIQSQFDKSKAKARKELRAEYAATLKTAERMKAQFEVLFGESIDADQKGKKGKGRPAGAKKSKGSLEAKGSKKVAGTTPFTLKEVEGFLEMKKEGIPVKLAGRKPVSIAKMEEAFKKTQDPKGILEVLNI